MNSTPHGSMPLVLAPVALFEGLRAGAGTFRAIVDLPARFELGPLAFGAFSKATDLSTRGVVFYVVFGVGGLVVTALAFGAAWRLKASRAARAALLLSCLCSVLVLLATTQAAPLMWKLGASQDPALIRSLLDRFVVWTQLRVVLVDVSFLAVLAAMTLESRRESGRQAA
jgi:Na+-driven multidrug efflux pump